MKDHNDHSVERCDTTSIALIDRARSQNDEAWHRLVRLYSPLVDYWLAKGGIQPDDVDDVRQEIFFAVHRNIDGFRPDGNCGSFRRWLFSITRCRLADHRRKLRNRPWLASEDELLAMRQVSYDPQRDAEADGPKALTILYRQAIELVRRGCNDTTWQAFYAIVMEDRSAAEVAQQLAISLNAVYIAKARVLNRLRDEFAALI